MNKEGELNTCICLYSSQRKSQYIIVNELLKKASRHRDKGKRTDVNNTNILETEKQMMNYRLNALKKVEF